MNNRIWLPVSVLVMMCLQVSLLGQSPSSQTRKVTSASREQVPTAQPSNTPQPSSEGTSQSKAVVLPTKASNTESKPNSTTEKPLSSDSGFLAGLTQALATVLAVFFGFILSMLAEKRAWKRRKQEQIRDKQLGALLSFIACAHDVIRVAKENESKILKAIPEISAAGISGGAAAEARLKAHFAAVEDAAIKLAVAQTPLSLKLAELRLLRLNESGVAFAAAFNEEVQGLCEAILNIRNNPIGQDVASAKIALVSRKFEELISGGLEALHE